MTSSIRRDPIQGLIDYILDIKPYHSKIAEVLVEYSVNDNVNVTIEDSHFMDIVATENYDSLFACDEGFGVLPFGGPDTSIAYMPDLTIDGYITYPTVPLQLPIVYIDPFTFAYYTVIGVNPLTGTWTISGNHVNEFLIGQPLHIDQNSGGGNGGYTILAVAPSGPNTAILVNEIIPTGASANGTLSINVGGFFIEGDYSSVITTGSNLSINNSQANNGVWRVISATHETGESNPPGFDPEANLTEIRLSFVSAFRAYLPLFNVNSFTSPYQFDIAGIDFDQHYSVGDAFRIENSTQSYNNSSWFISAITPITGGFRVSSTQHVMDPNFTNLTISPVLSPLTILPVLSINTTENLFFVAGNYVADFGIGSFFNAVDLINMNPNQGRWVVTAPAPVFDAINNLTRITAQFNQIFAVPNLTFAIISASNVTDDFVIAGNQTSFFAPEDEFIVAGTALNDGAYIVLFSTFNGVNTTIKVDGVVPANQGAGGDVITQVSNGEVLVFARSNWDLPEICKTASTTTTSSFIGETLEFISGTELIFNDILDTEICDLTASVGWGAGDGSEFRHILGGSQGSQQFFVQGDVTTTMGSSYPLASANHVTNTLVVAGDITNIFTPGRIFSLGNSAAVLPFPITLVSTGFSGTWRIAGDQTYIFTPGKLFTVVGNSGTGNGIYTVNSSSFSGGNTIIVVAGSVPLGATPDGNITINVSNDGSYAALSSTYDGFNTTINVSNVPITDVGFGTIYITLLYVINSTGNDGSYNVESVSYSGITMLSTITVSESIPSATFDGTILYQPITANPSFSRTGWDDCGWDTQAGLTLYQYILSGAPPTDTFITLMPDGGTVTPHGYSEGDVVTVSGALPLPSPFVVDTAYYVHVVSATSFKLATSAANLAANIFIVATTTGNTEYQYIEKENAWLNYTSGKLNGSDPGSFLNTYANASFTESLSIAVTFGEDAGTVVGSWDYPYWDVGGYDEDTETLLSLYGSSF